ncbi:MAG: hypothetical protein ACKO6N_03270 [Myxococcota bacterium]
MPAETSSRARVNAPFFLSHLLLLSCSEMPEDSPTPEVPIERISLTSNFQVGGLALLHADGTVSAAQTVLHGDAVAREAFGLLYVVNRLGGDNIQVLDPAADFATIQQLSVGAGSNPQDIAVVSSQQAFVAAYNRSALLEVDLSTGALLRELDLSSFAADDPDGYPELSSVLLVEDRLVVALQRLERTSSGYIPLGDSYLVQLDVQSGQVLRSLRLAYANPVGLLKAGTDGLLRVPLSGRFGVVGDGGVELIEPRALTSLGVLVDEQTLQGDVLAVTGAQPLYVVTGQDSVGMDARTALLRWDGDGIETLLQSNGWHLWDVEADANGVVWCTDRNLKAPGVWKLSPEDSTPVFTAFGAEVLPPTWWSG